MAAVSLAAWKQVEIRAVAPGDQLVIQLNHFAASFWPLLATPDFCRDQWREHSNSKVQVVQEVEDFRSVEKRLFVVRPRSWAKWAYARARQHRLAEIAAGHAVKALFS